MTTGTVSSAANLGGAPASSVLSQSAAAAVAAAQARLAAAAASGVAANPAASQPTAGNTVATEELGESTRVITSDALVTSSENALRNGKTFYHRVAGARTNLPDGREIRFLGGLFITDDEEIIRELNKVCDRPASGIFSKQVGVVNMMQAESQLALEARDTVGDNRG